MRLKGGPNLLGEGTEVTRREVGFGVVGGASEGELLGVWVGACWLRYLKTDSVEKQSLGRSLEP